MSYVPDELIDEIRKGIELDEAVGEQICCTAAAARKLIEWIDKPEILHSAHSVDRYPICMPVEFWDTHRFAATIDDAKVTCQKCKDVLEQMYAEIGRPD